MCGITGIMAFNESGKAYLSSISAATYSLISRGPDGEGISFHTNTALGHRRLSIIDTSNNASQPFKDPTGRYTIVFNGEIFNFKELREKLEKSGRQFRSQSDTEVLLYLYIEHGSACLEQLDGEFAFAIYDEQKEELFLARDRYGIKPLYYYKDQDRFVFASEMKAMMAFQVPRNIDKTSLQIYLHLNYIPSPWSIFENILKLESGSYLTITQTGKLNTQKYYSIPSRPESSLSMDYTSAKKKLRETLERSVQKRMIADVPLGTFLSGGLDSSIVSAIAANHTKQLHTFSVGYKDEPFFDETKYALLLAKRYKTEHTVFSLSNDDIFADLHHVLDYMDEPFADSSALAVSILSKRTREHVTVALSGDGADELFGGYNKHAAELKARNGSIANKLVGTAHPLLKVLPKSRNSKTGNKIRQLQKFAEGLDLNDKERYWRWAGFTEKDQTLLKSSPKEFCSRKEQLLSSIDDDFNSVLLTDMKLVLENDMLVKTDRMSMSHGLEIRVPFLSQEIVDLAFSLPSHYKIDNSQRKKILKETFSDLLPEELLQRKKQGFEVPLLKWFQTELKSMITNDLLKDDFIKEQGLFDPEAITKLKAQLFSTSPNDAVARIWALIVFQYWWKKQFRKI